MMQIPSGDELRFKGIAVAVADGVSRCRRAAMASRTCVADFLSNYYSTPPSWTVENSVARVLNALNQWMFNQSHRSGTEQDELACTLAALVLKSNTAHLFHVGDSRIYLFREGELSLLTRDHCSYQQGQKAYLTRAMGIDTHLEIDHRAIGIHPGDRFLLITDGVSEVLDDRRLLTLLQQTDDQCCAEQINAAAFDAGSADNLTAVVVTVQTLPQQDVDEAHRALTRQVIPPVLEVGQSLDGFKVVKVLFNGTRSHVYLVENNQGERFALKAPSASFADDPIYLDGFIREEWVGIKLKHRNVMGVYRRPDSRFLYHICEYIEGITLRQWMHDHPSPPLADVRQIVRQIIAGLRHMQRNQMVHRDLKPENILLCADGRVKLVDFGTASVAGWDEIPAVVREDREVPVGSVHYIAPEYLLGQPASSRSDLFSLGMIVYEMLVGRRPFKDTDFRTVRPTSFHAWAYSAGTLLRKDLPLWVDLALKKACAPNPLQRYSSFSEFAQDLQEPNRTLLGRYQSAPLIERDPVRFWQLGCVLLALVAIVEGYLLLG